jgi:leucyl-tRNA synthetase
MTEHTAQPAHPEPPDRERYNPQHIEGRWQARWEADGLYRARVDWSRPKHYALTMLPYPSGDLHIGHWFAMTPSDARARFMRMRGYNVLFPMGFDAFGLPAENAAVQRGVHPAAWTHGNIERMRGQLRSMGAMFDWEREIVSCEPDYYRWTEWFFKQFYEHDLAYRGEALVNWSDALQTVLANEQVIDGKDERLGQPVVQKLMTQWFFRYTRYIDELLDFSGIDWPDPIRIMQTNWIGRSEGARVTFHIADADGQPAQPFEIFTTRPDTLWGVSFMVLAPEHPLVQVITTPEQREAVLAYVEHTATQTEIERTSEAKAKTGVWTGAYAINPVNGAQVPVWIADYVMLSYGTGAIMAVPYGDQRDYDFARAYNLKILPIIQPADGPIPEDKAYDGPGTMINSGPFDRTFTTGEKGRKNPAIAAVLDWLTECGYGREAVNYRLRDWLISRQRYWGSPIPVLFREDGSIETISDGALPVLLPDDVEMTGTGNPLGQHPAFPHAQAADGTPARRETDTMDTFMCSSWYYYRYLSPRYTDGPFSPEEAAYWLPVDTYTGGAEHATMHLLYSRWFTKAMRDLGMFDEAARIMREHGRDPEVLRRGEPMLQLRNQGQVLGAERPGDVIAATGRYEGRKLFADRVEVLAANTATAGRALPEDAVVGEIIKRTENLLTVNMGGELRTVEVTDGAEVIIPGIPGPNTVNQLRHHLEIQRMSKSKGNVVNPDELVERYGADAVRAYLMSAFEWGKGGPWNNQQIQGVIRWLNEVWDWVLAGAPTGEGTAEGRRAAQRAAHQANARVAQGLETFSFNTPIAALMTFKNEVRALTRAGALSAEAWREAAEHMVLLMAPFTPHIAEELWARLGCAYSVHMQAWPAYDAALAAEDAVTLVIMRNGKPIDRVSVPADIDEAGATALALASEAVRKVLGGGAPKRVVFIAARAEGAQRSEPKVNIVV